MSSIQTKIILLLPFGVAFNPRKAAAQESLVQTLESMPNISVDLTILSTHFLESQITLKQLNARRFKRILVWLIIYVSVHPKIQRRLWHWLLKRILTTYVRQQDDFNLMYSNSMWGDTNNIAYFVHKRTNLKYFIHEHRTHFARKISGDKISIEIPPLNAASAVFALSKPHRSAITNFTTKDVSVIPIAMLDNQFYFPPDAVRPDPSITFFAWTNWRNLKRLDRLIDAFLSATEKSQKPVKLVIAGPIVWDDFSPKLKHYLKIDSKLKIKYVGELSRQKIQDMLKNTDFTVIPSDFETLGLPALESLCFGVPVLTTRSGGPEDFVDEPFNGLITKDNSTESLSDTLLNAINNRDAFNRIKIAKDSHVKYSTAAIAQKLSIEFFKVF